MNSPGTPTIASDKAHPPAALNPSLTVATLAAPTEASLPLDPMQVDNPDPSVVPTTTSSQPGKSIRLVMNPYRNSGRGRGHGHSSTGTTSRWKATIALSDVQPVDDDLSDLPALADRQDLDAMEDMEEDTDVDSAEADLAATTLPVPKVPPLAVAARPPVQPV